MVQSGCGKGTVTTKMTNHSILITLSSITNDAQFFQQFLQTHCKSVKRKNTSKKAFNGCDTKEIVFVCCATFWFSSKRHHSLFPSQPCSSPSKLKHKHHKHSTIPWKHNSINHIIMMVHFLHSFISPSSSLPNRAFLECLNTVIAVSSLSHNQFAL